jgi:hypothetical protein
MGGLLVSVPESLPYSQVTRPVNFAVLEKKGKKRAKSGAALWIFLAVGGGVLLLVLIGGGVGLMYVLKGGGPSPTAPGNNQTPGLLVFLRPRPPMLQR